MNCPGKPWWTNSSFMAYPAQESDYASFLPGYVVSSVMRLRVVVPHFFREDIVGSNGGYGSGRLGNQLPRSLALGRCLGAF